MLPITSCTHGGSSGSGTTGVPMHQLCYRRLLQLPLEEASNFL